MNIFKIRYFIILFFIFFAALIIFGCDPSSIGSSDYGSAQINGYVMDASSLNALGNVTIYTYPASDSVETTENGNFFIYKFYLNSNPQEIMIIAEKAGYKTAQVKKTIYSDEVADVTITMIKK